MADQRPSSSNSMAWSWRIFRIADIDINVHVTFWLLLIWVSIGYWQLEGTVASVVSGVVFVLAIFGCVVLHELGHSLVARHYGIQTRNITLLPIGGLAALEKMPDKPEEEMLVAIAGPIVNLLIACLIFVWLSVDGVPVSLNETNFADAPFLVRLLSINVLLAVFNLLPALPMDGGRVFRAALAMRMDHLTATKKAAKLGQNLALGLGFIGLLFNPLLVFIAVFVWLGAAMELKSTEVRSALSGVRMDQVMLTDFTSLDVSDSLGTAVELTLKGSQRDFPVLDENEIVGNLTHADLLQGLREDGDAARVSTWMRQDAKIVDANELLNPSYDELAQERTMLSVTRKGQLVGLVNLDNIQELLRIHAALEDAEDSNRMRHFKDASTHSH